MPRSRVLADDASSSSTRPGVELDEREPLRSAASADQQGLHRELITAERHRMMADPRRREGRGDLPQRTPSPCVQATVFRLQALTRRLVAAAHPRVRVLDGRWLPEKRRSGGARGQKGRPLDLKSVDLQQSWCRIGGRAVDA
ncbi:hypothetical protein ACP70R_015569 [Stipagrostis hirtigluma subsp. patula]